MMTEISASGNIENIGKIEDIILRNQLSEMKRLLDGISQGLQNGKSLEESVEGIHDEHERGLLDD